MAGGGKPVLGGIDPFSCEQFEIVLEDELIQDFELHTLVKPTSENYNEYSQRYNMICRWFEKVLDKPSISRLIDLRYQAKRAAMAGQTITMEFSPYSDEGAAIAYGYIEGGIELLALKMKMAMDAGGA